MTFQKLHELESAVLGMELVTSQEWDRALSEAGAMADPAEIVKILERQGSLTSYQASKLAKGETDSLRVGDYKLLYRNAAGSFARVFRACSVSNGKMVGIKLLRSRWCSDPASIDMFHREGTFGKRLVHKNIVPIHEVGSDGGQHYIAMEFVEGGNFKDFLKIRRKLSPKEAMRYIRDIAEGLEYALGLNVTHRDMKMTNVLISAQGTAKLVDFGLAGTEAAGPSGDPGQRTVEYASIEEGSNAPINDPRTDLFFVGTIFYELVTGIPPFPPSKDREERRRFSRYTSIRPVRQIDPSLPRRVVDIVDRLLHINPNERYQTPTELIGDLNRALKEMGDDTVPEVNGTPLPQAAAKSQATVLCVESRLKHQDLFRTYLTKRGFRTLVLADAERAVMRIKNNPPDGVVIMGEPLGEDLRDMISKTAPLSERSQLPILVIATEAQADVAEEFGQFASLKFLQQPVTLRTIREEVVGMIQRLRPDVPIPEQALKGEKEG